MQKININGNEITSLSHEDMADYIKRVYDAKEMKSLSQNGKSFDQIKQHSSMLAEFLVQYAIATGDLSDESISRIASNYLTNFGDYISFMRNNCTTETGKSAKHLFFEEVVMPELITTWADKLNIQKPISVVNLSKIASVIATQSQNNAFRTHSFNSAILPSVEENGLDISREMFKEDLKQFTPVGNQVYKTGALNTCELSQASFTYATIVPERVRNIMSGNCNRQQQEDETLAEHLSECVSSSLENNPNLTVDEKRKLKNDSEKIIQFYYGHTSASIAVIKQERKPVAAPANCDVSIMYALSTFLRCPQSRKISPKPSIEFKRQLEALAKEIKSQDILERLDTLLNETRQTSPETENFIQSLKKYIFGDCLCRQSLSHLLHSTADGFDIEGGKINRADFAIATYDDPAKVFSYERSQARKSTQESD